MTRAWYYKGKRPRLVRQQQFLNAYIFGATCAEKGKTAGLISPFCNSYAMQEHLNIIEKEVVGHAVIVLDGAGWHSAKSLKIPNNITLLPLPPYSPELNPQENFWQTMKSDSLSNRVFESTEKIMDVCQAAWCELAENTDKIKSLCRREWADISTLI